eukprot:TRINITY_DN15024_c0_g1_i7.p1 TRINITY_DN15024_c0_g1~~TRINITY_DN15024_c0_g1_i7.p1  ORF type:complete len:378 (+),score=49.57 TRINITY_DN15024_c0_g1_i7:101-1234(+)
MNDIISNSNGHLASVFKDYLIYDDLTEILQQFYNANESRSMLKQLITYYEISTIVFPNFVALCEKKYILKNIRKKQKLLDLLRQDKKKSKAKCIPNKIFDRKFMDESSLQLSRKNMATIIDDFIRRDSASLLNKSSCTNIEATFCDQHNPAKPASVKPNARNHIRHLTQPDAIKRADNSSHDTHNKVEANHSQPLLHKKHFLALKVTQGRLFAVRHNKREQEDNKERVNSPYLVQTPSNRLERQYSDFTRATGANWCSSSGGKRNEEFRFSKKLFPKIKSKHILPKMIILGKNMKCDIVNTIQRSNNDIGTQKSAKHFAPINTLKLANKKPMQSNSKQDIAKIKRVHSPYSISTSHKKLFRQRTEAELKGSIKDSKK